MSLSVCVIIIQIKDKVNLRHADSRFAVVYNSQCLVLPRFGSSYVGYTERLMLLSAFALALQGYVITADVRILDDHMEVMDQGMSTYERRLREIYSALDSMESIDSEHYRIDITMKGIVMYTVPLGYFHKNKVRSRKHDLAIMVESIL